jgi:hypothetical protein
MAVVIEEMEVQVQPQPAESPAGGGAQQPQGGELDERALQAALAREAWRIERLSAD